HVARRLQPWQPGRAARLTAAEKHAGGAWSSAHRAGGQIRCPGQAADGAAATARADASGASDDDADADADAAPTGGHFAAVGIPSRPSADDEERANRASKWGGGASAAPCASTGPSARPRQ